ncbi:hypothetical protein DM02DRAFT_617693 [Periconia macrospinosa]|uniref:dolichol kinase n=1 Tax=Periconia macrospinosa TaxID=97972 RepID=A0A2V1DC32_9PLEO|nr:hypothetical protein DM02DRAFT_617693 [Periconia macrospinosa]
MAAQDAELPEPPLEPPSTSDIESLELFRRSPHPYHHHQSRGLQTSAESSSTDFLRTSLHPDHDEGRRRTLIQSPSESGTEADDEGLGFIKALPAPPLRPRKGLRAPQGAGLDGGASPLLTPSVLDEDALNFGNKKTKFPSGGGSSPTDDEAQAARQKYLKRRRNEVLRRATEAALLAAISLLAIHGSGAWTMLLQRHQVELLTHTLVMVSVLAIYPLRLLLYSLRRTPQSNLRFRQRIRIPAAFDPAPILYPAVIPVLISISLFTSNHALLLPNILLGLAAIPPQLIPYGLSVSNYSTIHWFISILPLIAFQKAHGDSDSLLSDLGLHAEILVTLFPLHQALLPPLHYLTTTSLLITELHLLSIGLINLLLFSNSPQGNILTILLWLGGLGVFVLCGKVLKWGVALARIPKWRFRRAGQVIKARQSFIHALNERVHSLRSNSASRAIEDSDADEDNPLIKIPTKKARNLKLKIIDSLRDDHHSSPGGEVQSAVEAKKDMFERQTDPHSPTSISKRRNTLPSLPSQTNASPPSHHHHRRRARSIAQSFLALTPTQAVTRKWLYALYFYLVVITLILGPIRYLIGKTALYGHEPFGWAIGYLFGHIQRLRFEVYNWDLENWIPLPPLSSSPPTTHLTPIEHLRHAVLGEANTRLLLCIYCALTIASGLIVVLSLSNVIVEVDTRRKVFHGTMVAMLLPTIYIDPCFVSLALALVLAIFLLLDLIRASQLPPLSGPIATFLTPYVDGRDLRGPVVVSHIFLLIGCAIPLWLSLAGVQRTGEEPWQGWDVQLRDVSMVSGVVCVGMGDAAASLVGRRYGRRKWVWKGGKSLEGSLAFAGAVTVGLVVGRVWLGVGWGAAANNSGDDSSREKVGFITAAIVLAKALLCAAGASLEEAVLTGGNDNVIVPVVLWVLVRGVGL